MTTFLLAGSSIVSSASASAGLPVGVLPTTLARVSDGTVAGGTPSAGMWRLVGSSWSGDNGGLSGTESILTARVTGGTLYTSTGTALFARQQAGWTLATGAPALVQALGGATSILFAAPASGIASATLGDTLPAAWRSDDAGANTAFVSSLDAGNGMAFAAGGTAGVLRPQGRRLAGRERGPPGRRGRARRPARPPTCLFAGTAETGSSRRTRRRPPEPFPSSST